MFRDLDIIVDNSIPDANEITKALVLNNAKFENPKFIISNEKHNFLIPVSPSWLTDSLICRRMFPLSFYSNYIGSTSTYPLFLLNIEIFIDKSIPSFEYIDSLLLAGAILVDSPSKNCIHVSNHVLNIDCKLANANWIKKILSQRRFIDPKKSILTYPIPKDPIPGFNELLICVSGYVKNRDMIEYMVVKGGAKFTRVLSKSCSHLITKRYLLLI